MRLYIDPGTGSMLFAILIGVLGAGVYVFKSWLVKLRFLFTGGKKEQGGANKKIPLAVFSDDKRYYSVFYPVLRELDRRGIDVEYLTASQDDPAFSGELTHVHPTFLGEGNRAFAKLNFLHATLLLSTTPGLDVYQWKRSKDVDYYVHMLHAASEVSTYRMFGIDYYDAVLLSGEYQRADVRAMEQLRGLPEKEIEMIGIPYMDEMLARLKNDAPLPPHERTVLLAPSWGDSAIFKRYGGKIIDVLLQTGCHIIVRPHPQSFRSETEMMEKLMAEYPASEQLEWNRDNDNYEVLRRSDILISDFSGVIFDFCLVYDKPVIYTDTKFDKGPYDAWWLEHELWTFDTLPRVGKQLTPDNMDTLKEMIEECITSPEYAAGRDRARAETWEYMGQGAQRAADYLENKLNALSAGKEKA